MRIRFELQSLAALGAGPHRLPVNCWRLTLLYTVQAAFPSVLLEGQNFTNDLLLNSASGSFGLARIVVGGVFLPDGTPVNMDQVLRVTVGLNEAASGVLVYEYLEP